MAWWKVDLKTGCLISLSLCESWWLHGKSIWSLAGWSLCICVRADGLMESPFEDWLDDLLVFVWKLMIWWKVDLETGWLISLSFCESWWLNGKLIWRLAGWSLCLFVRADGLMERWFEDRLSDLFVIVWELMAWWKVHLKTGWLISLSLCESWWFDRKLIWRQAGWSLCLFVRADGLMESWFEDWLADLFVFLWELMASWKVDLKTGWLISLSLCESWWLHGNSIWRLAGWSPCLCVKTDGLMESWFEDRLADLSDLFVFVWDVIAWWKVDLKTGFLIFFALVCELMAWWNVDLKTGCPILSLWKS